MSTKKADPVGEPAAVEVSAPVKTKGQCLLLIAEAHVAVAAAEEALQIARFNLDQSIRDHNMAPENL